MKPLVRALAVCLVTTMAAATALPAHADRGGHGWRGGHGHHGYHGGPNRHHGHYGHRHGVWGPLIVGGLIGAAIVGATAHAQPVQPVVVPVQPVAPVLPSHLVPAPSVPPLVPAPPQPLPSRVQYYCAPYRAYYPFVASCPEPWYVMPL